ncbi:MAG: protein-disulfide reductase DsbD N-terminal domain-containing protein [Muribaculaceae bacterium]|nr:protein-disulfide reductase DsbD N-terminal domain-containing protein [Muribaculaceae bacterium]MDE5594158.1 protein-disulfide reductase DsbD N-terminal domain-containing protein [Muribaculaceae bacterium]MDE6702461.1 protein-disulfide reductase DsbD N-terminal domain-containing protein [Muribaculaceae bacterium]
MKKALFLLIALMTITFATEAQSPVRWRTSVRMTSPTEGEISIKALISEGWHLYALEMPAGGPKATSFDFSGSTGISLDGAIQPSESPITQMDPLFGKTLSWWDRNVTFTQRFTLKERKDARVKVSIYFMSCNGGTCTPPKTETITTIIPEYNPSELNHSKKTR